MSRYSLLLRHQDKENLCHHHELNPLAANHITLYQSAAITMGRRTTQLVTGPAGSGKSTYSHILQEHVQTLGPRNRRRIHVVNLDPAAEHFRYDVAFDIRELISVDDVMEELQLGPNGSLVYCMEYLLENMDSDLSCVSMWFYMCMCVYVYVRMYVCVRVFVSE